MPPRWARLGPAHRQEPRRHRRSRVTCLLAGVIGARLLHVLADGHFLEYVYLCTNPAKVTWHIPRGECVRIHDAGWLVFVGLDSTHALGRWDDAEGVCHPVEASCFAWAEFYNGGLTYYGGLIVASLWAVYVLRRDRFPFWKAADMAGFAVPLGLCFGRMGCLLAGCCFGVESSSRLALSFPPHSPATEAQFKAGELLLARSVVQARPSHANLRIGHVLGHRCLLSSVGSQTKALRWPGLRYLSSPLCRRALHARILESG